MTRKKQQTKEVIMTTTGEGKPVKYAYTITDKVFGELKVLQSANAWWIDKGKVEALINAFKYDATVEEALISAGISYEQLKYFREIHPEFSLIESRCREVPGLKARQTVVGALDKDPHIAFKYLERKKANEFGTKEKAPIVVIPISMRGTAKDYSPQVINGVEGSGAA
jgi:hypothetical protein